MNKFNADVTGPDGKQYEIFFTRNIEIEEILYDCSKIRIIVYEGKFPWVKTVSVNKYKVHLKDGWQQFNTPVRGGFVSETEKTAYLHKNLPIEEKLAIAFHELIHILEQHPEGLNIETERITTEAAIALIAKNQEYLDSKNINTAKIITSLQRRGTFVSKISGEMTLNINHT